MIEDITYEWAELMATCSLSRKKAGIEAYNKALDIVRRACCEAFDIRTDYWFIRLPEDVAILQKEELPWDYIFECIRRSGKVFYVIVPSTVNCELIPVDKTEGKRMAYAWYNREDDCINIKAYTGKCWDEEDTSPGYDGWGRYDTYYEVVHGMIGRNGSWIVRPDVDSTYNSISIGRD